MKKKSSIALLILVYIITIALYMLCVIICMKACGNTYSLPYIICMIVGAVAAWIPMPLIHECGHLLFGKINGFKAEEIKLYFWLFYKSEGNTHCKFLPHSGVAGACSMVPVGTKKIKSRFRAVTSGGIVMTGFFTLLAFALVCLCGIIDGVYPVYAFFVMWLPACFFYTAFNAVPFENEEGKSDGAVLYGLAHGLASEETALNILRIQASLTAGKTPSEIKDKYYFSAPQIMETDPNFAAILQLRYYYFLECGEQDKAKECIARLRELYPQMNPALKQGVLPDILIDSVLNNDPEIDEYLADSVHLKERKDYSAYIVIACSLFMKNSEKKAAVALRKADDLLSFETMKGLGPLRRRFIEKLEIIFK